MYFVKGIGLGAGFNVSHDDVYPSADDISQSYRTYSGDLTIHCPIGIEHFFWEKFPNVSYSLDADIYGSFYLSYRRTQRIYPESYYTDRVITENDWYLRPSFGISPSFYLRVYF